MSAYEFVKVDRKKHKYVVGIDFGHGETSASYCVIPNIGTVGTVLPSPKNIMLEELRYAMPSTLSKSIRKGTNGENKVVYKIGIEAINEYKEVNGTEFYCYFKDRPSRMNNSQKVIVRVFMNQVYKHVFKCLQEIESDFNESNHVVYIACPSSISDWTKNEQDEYAAIALSAGIPLALVEYPNGGCSAGIIRESRAAFLRVRSDGNVKQTFDQGALLIDFGSSTVDLTYYSSSCKSPIDDGYFCGASEVEKIIFNQILSDMKDGYNNDDKEMVKLVRQCPSIFDVSLFEVRREKERYFSEHRNSFVLALDYEELSQGKIESSKSFSYKKNVIDDWLTGYKNNIKKSFLEYKNKHLNGRNVKQLVLTGGASCMPFVRELAKDVFKCNDEFIEGNEDSNVSLNKTDRSVFISNGIASAGRSDIRIKWMLEDLFNHPTLKLRIADEVISKADNDIVSLIMSNIGNKIQEFSGFYPPTKTINGLNLKIKSTIDDAAHNYQTYLNQAFLEVFKEKVSNSLKNSLNDIVREYFPSYSIPDPYVNSNITVSSIEISETFTDGITKAVGDVVCDGFLSRAGKFLFNIYVAAPMGIIGGTIFHACDTVEKWANGEKQTRSWGDTVSESFDAFAAEECNEYTELSMEQRGKVRDKFVEDRGNYKSDLLSRVKGEHAFQDFVSVCVPETLSEISVVKKRINEKYAIEVRKYIISEVEKARLILD